MRSVDSDDDAETIRQKVIKSADLFVEKSVEGVKTIAKIGANRIQDGYTILTHCNSKAALAPIIEAHNQGKKIHVFATESRPWRQGLLTISDLSKAGVPVTLIIDSAVRLKMKDADCVFVGADTVYSNGNLLNKIGTSQVAQSAFEFEKQVYVCTETYKFSPKSAAGHVSEIEERDISEVIEPERLPDGVKVSNPVFDETPARYITGYITEEGIMPPAAVYNHIVSKFGIENLYKLI